MKRILSESNFKITQCRVCDGENLVPVIDLGNQPLANNYLKWANSFAEKYPLNCVLCADCDTFQLGYSVDKKNLFQTYLYNSSTSPVFIKHMEELAQTIEDKYHPVHVVEFGSNDGILLKPLKELDIQATGVESAGNLARECRYQGHDVIISWAESKRFAKDFVAKRGKANVVVACNVFAHIHNLKAVMANGRDIMTDDGTMIVEVVHLLKMIQNNTFDMIYHEHFFSWSLIAFTELANRLGMSVVDVEEIPTHGGSLRLYIEKGTRKITGNVKKIIDEELEAGLNKAETYKRLQNTIDIAKYKLMDILYELRSEGKTIIGYGAPAKANTLMSYFDIGREHVEYIIDDAPMKQGLFTPFNHLEIRAMPEQIDADYILILAWNFATPIMQKCRDAGYKGQFILPFPNSKII